MAEKIVYDIEFKGLADAQAGLKDITKKQIEQAEAVKQAKAEIKEFEKSLKELNEATVEGAELTQEDIQNRQDLTDKIQAGKESLAEENDTLKEVNAERRNAVTEIQALDNALESNLGSNQQLKAELKLLTAQYNELSEEERDNTDTGKELGDQILKITDNLKENESAIGDNRRNVGNYSGAIEGALGNINIMGVNLGQMSSKLREGVESGKSMFTTMTATATATTAQATATKGATVASGGFAKALKIVKFALISTGIGAIIVLVGALVAAFASTQQGADSFKRAIAPVKAVMSTLLGILQKVSIFLVDKLVKSFKSIKDADLGKVFRDIGDSIKQNILNRLEAFGMMGKAIVKILKGDIKAGLKDLGNAAAQGATGVENAIGKITDASIKAAAAAKNAAKETANLLAINIAHGQKIVALEIFLAKAKIKSVTKIAEINKNLKEQRLISADMLLSDGKRIRALNSAISLSKQKIMEEKKLLQQELNIAKAKTKFNDTDRDAHMEIANLKASMLNLDAQGLSEQKMMKTMLTGIQLKNRKAEEKRLSSIKSLISSEKELAEAKLKTQLASLGLDKKDLTAEELEAKETLTNTHLDKMKQMELASAKEIADKRLKVINDAIKKETNINTLAALKKEALYYKDLNNTENTEAQKIAITKAYNLERIQDTKDALNETLKNLTDQLNSSTDSEGLSVILSDEESLALQTRLADTTVKIEKLNQEYQKVGKDPDTGEKTGMAKLLGVDNEEAEKISQAMDAVGNAMVTALGGANELVGIQTKKRIGEVDKAVKDGLLTEEEAEQKKTKIRKEQGKKQQAISIATATIQYAQGVVAALASAMVIPPPFGAIIGAANIAALTATYGVSVAKIKAQSYAEGGYVQGPGTGTSDSIQANLSNGEFVQTKKATQYYGKDFMHAVNTMQLPRLNFAEGGLVAPLGINNVSSQISRGEQNIADSISDSQIEVINIESTFTNKQNQVKNVETATTY